MEKKVIVIISKFSEINGVKFVGIRNYESSTTHEIANHVVNIGFSYENAVNKDLAKLRSLTKNDINNIIFENKSKNFTQELVKQAIEELKTAFENNKDSETKSNQSIAQSEAYIPITTGIKLHKESHKVYIYALSVSKEILVMGEYKAVKSRDLTLCKNAVKKYCDFSTAKFRQFIVDDSQLESVRISGENLTLK